MNAIAIGQDMRNLIFGSVLTGMAVTAGIFLLQEYRTYEAEQAAYERAMAPIKARLVVEGRCAAPLYDDFVTNNINSKKIVRLLLIQRCHIDPDVGLFIHARNLAVDHNFPLADVDLDSPEGQRQVQWSIDYRRNGYKYETEDDG